MCIKRCVFVWIMCFTIGSGGVVRVLARAFHRFRGVTKEASAAFRTDYGRESPRLSRREGINNNIFNPIAVVTRTAAVFVPAAWIGIEFQKFVPYRIGHMASPAVFAQTVDIL